MNEGLDVGRVGINDGNVEGSIEGVSDGSDVGSIEGITEGAWEGLELGKFARYKFTWRR